MAVIVYVIRDERCSPDHPLGDAVDVLVRREESAAVKAGVPWAELHTLRHTCASLLFARGENPKTIQRWLGHHRASFTLDTYIHLLSDDLPEGIEVEDLACDPTDDCGATEGQQAPPRRADSVSIGFAQ